MYKAGKYRKQELIKWVALCCTVAICGSWGASYSADLYCQTRLTSWGITHGSVFFHWNELHEVPPRESVDWAGDLLDANWLEDPLWTFESYDTELLLSISLLFVASPCFLVWVVLAVKTQRRRLRVLTKACIQCGYPLTPSSSPACPECGLSRHDQFVAAMESVGPPSKGFARKSFRFIAGTMICIIWLGSMALPVLYDKAQWSSGGSQVGLISGWLVYEQEPTLPRASSFRDGNILSPDDWLFDTWLSWQCYQACHQLRIRLRVVAIVLSVFIGALAARLVVLRMHTTAFGNAVDSLQDNLRANPAD